MTVDTVQGVGVLLVLLLFLIYSFTVKTFIVTFIFVKNIAKAEHFKVSSNIHSLQNPMLISTMKKIRVAACQCKFSIYTSPGNRSITSMNYYIANIFLF